MTEGTPVGVFYSWWRTGPEPLRSRVYPKVEASFQRDSFDSILPFISAEERQNARTWIEQDNELFTARVDEHVAAWGWMATRTAEVGELGIILNLPPDNRYLWNFVTLPEWRGYRMYPALLTYILESETSAARFWIGHDLENQASESGVLRAGFRPTGRVLVMEDGSLQLSQVDHDERFNAAVELLGLPVLESGNRAFE